MSNDSIYVTEPEGEHSMEQPGLIWTRNFTLLCLANFTLFMSTQVLFPVLPGYLLLIGGEQRDVGYVMGVYTICAMCMRPLAGWLVDNYGRKKIMILGMAIMLAVSTLYRFAAEVPLMMLIRGCHGMAFGMVSTALGTMVADSLPTLRLGEGMGYFGLTSSLSMSVAPVLGFFLVGRSGYPMLFITVALLTMLAFGCSLPVRSVKTPSGARRGSVAGMWANLFEKTALPASAVMFFLAAVYGAVLSYISLYAAEFGITNIGLFFTAIALSMLIFRPLSGRWSDMGGTNRVILIGHLALLVGMVVTGLSHTITTFLLAGTLLGIGFGFCIPTLQAIAVRTSPIFRRGAATGTFFAAFDLGIGLGTIVWGYVAEITGYQMMFFSTLVPVALAGIIYYWFRTERRERRGQA